MTIDLDRLNRISSIAWRELPPKERSRRLNHLKTIEAVAKVAGNLWMYGRISGDRPGTA